MESKVQQLADKITQAISAGEFAEGCALPSINAMSAELHLSRDTIYKAYQKLKHKGIIESAPNRGYYVRKTVNRVFVLLDVFSSYKNDFYRELTANLPLNYHVDLYFYQSNEQLFNTLIADSVGKYDLYVVTNFKNDVYYSVLDSLDSSRVLLLDLGKFPKDKFSYVCQGFDSTLYDCLNAGIDQIRKYSEIRFMFPTECEHPDSCIAYYYNFCKDNRLKYKLIRRQLEISDIERGVVYLIVRHSDVVDFIKVCHSKGYVLGKDIGLITFNDTPMLEVIENGISAISTDFMQMGKLAADYIKTRKKIQTYVPTRLIVRGSL